MARPWTSPGAGFPPLLVRPSNLGSEVGCCDDRPWHCLAGDVCASPDPWCVDTKCRVPSGPGGCAQCDEYDVEDWDVTYAASGRATDSCGPHDPWDPVANDICETNYGRQEPVPCNNEFYFLESCGTITISFEYTGEGDPPPCVNVSVHSLAYPHTQIVVPTGSGATASNGLGDPYLPVTFTVESNEFVVGYKSEGTQVFVLPVDPDTGIAVFPVALKLENRMNNGENIPPVGPGNFINKILVEGWVVPLT